MMKLKIILAIALLFAATGPLLADGGDVLGIGLHFGLQHDVGNSAASGSTGLTDPQNNYILGLSIKCNLSFVFLRTGLDRTFLINPAKNLEDSPTVNHYYIEYTSIPAFGGFAFPVFNVGELYMGAGITYFLVGGKIRPSAESKAQDISAVMRGYGFLTGIQLNITGNAKFYLEWQYIDARSGPLLKTQTAYDWKDYSVDLSGHRIFFGVMYHIL